MKFLSKTLAALGILAIWSALPLSANSGDDEAAWMANGASYIVNKASAEDSSPAENAQENAVLTEVKSNFLGRLAELGVTSGSKSLTDDMFSNIFNDVVAIALDPTSKTEVTNSAALTTNMTKETNGRTKLKEKAAGIFWWLALIQLGFVMGIEFIGNGLDLQVFVAALIRYFITVGFFWYIADKGPEILGSIISYFIDVGDELRGSTDLSAPTACFNMGIDLVYVCIQTAIARVGDVSVFDLNFKPLLDALIMAFVCTPCAIVVMITLMYIATTYVIMTFEGYFLVTISCLLLSLGGCRFTWGIVDHILRAMAQMGLKLMTCILLMHGVLKVSLTYMYDIAAGTSDMIVVLVYCLRLLGACLIFAFLSKSLPSYVASLIPGGNTGGTGVGFIGMMGAAAHTAGALITAPSKTANAVGRTGSNFMGGLRHPGWVGTGGNLGGGRTGWTMAGALGSAAGIGIATAATIAKAPIAGFQLGVELEDKANAPLGPVGKALDKAAGAAVGASHGLMRAADDPGKAMEKAADTAFGARKGLLNTIDNPGKVMDKVAGAAAAVGQAITSSAARGFNGIIGKSPDGTSNTSGNSGSGAVSGAGRSANNTPNAPSASGNSEKSAGSTGNNAAGGTGNAAGTAPNAPRASGNAQKSSGNNAKRAEGKAKTSAKSGEGAVFKGKGKMFEAAGFKKGAKPKGDGKE